MSTRPSQSADIAILVALEKELDAVLRSAGSWERHQTPSDIRTYYTSTTPAGLSVVAARSSGMGQINAALLARDVVALFKPRKVLLVGIAGGLGNEVSLGDIVVSDRIVDYEIGKVTPTGTTPRWSVYGSDALLRERLLDHRDLSWLARVRTARPDGDKSARPTIRSGIVLSGNKVIADATAAGALAEVWSRASAIEMEAAGIAAALYQSVDAPGFVMVKAICDRADASKDDSWQEYAAEVAAAFVASFVFGFLELSDARGQKKVLPDLTSDNAAPALAPERLTIRENSASERNYHAVLWWGSATVIVIVVLLAVTLHIRNDLLRSEQQPATTNPSPASERPALENLPAAVTPSVPQRPEESKADLQEKSPAEKETLIAIDPPVSTAQDVEAEQVLPDLAADKATPTLAPKPPTIREKSATEIFVNLKGIMSYQFHEKVQELYLGRWTQEPGWQGIVDDLPSNRSGRLWNCSFREVDSDTTVHASTVQDVSMLRPGDSVTVSGRISTVSLLKYVILEDAIVRGDNVPFP